MAAIDEYQVMMHGVQAVRRYVEGLACPISGASGVRARFYPHQVQNVRRILSSTQIRFLIADEVGMGKTVQALMVAHAMRHQAGRLRVKVVVSNSELKSQWVKEFCRIDKEIKEKDGIAWIENGSNKEDFCSVMDESELPPYAASLDTLSMDLLIIDEPQDLNVDTLRYLSDRAADFPAVLLLTATPNFRDLRRFCELLQILEPERMEYCRRQVFSEVAGTTSGDDGESEAPRRSRLRDLDQESLQKVFDLFERLSLEDGDQQDLIDEAGDSGLADMPQYQIDRILFDSKSTYRRILLSSREDYPEHLPRRRLNSMTIEPTTIECQRLEFARRATHSDTVLTAVEGRSLLQRTCVGGQSAAAFARYLAGRDDDRRMVMSPMLDFVKKEQADCRLDALVDWFSEFWQKDPTRKAVICAGDDATVRELVDELSWRLPEVGLRRNRMPLKMVKAESTSVGGSDLRGLSGVDAQKWRQSAESTVEPYSMGKSQLLIASDEYGQAINLQCSDALIFYSLPWRADMLNQWIGRVDRLGRDRVDPDKRFSPVKDVKILLLHRPGDPTENIEAVFSQYDIFRRSLQLDPALVGEISNRIDEAIATKHATDSRVIKSTDTDNRSRVNSGRWTPENAEALFDLVAHAKPMAPVLTHCEYDAYVSSNEESAFAKWLQQLCDHGMLSKKKVSKRFRGEGKRRTFFTMTQMHCKGPKIPRLEERDTTFPAFILARPHVLNPPRLEVTTGATQEGEPRKSRLHFLGHGGMLHSQLINTYADAGKTQEPIGFSIASLGKRFYPNGHSLEPGRYLCGVGHVDSGWIYDHVSPPSPIDDSPVSKAIERALRLIAAHREAGLRADQRFVRGIASARLCVRASVEIDGKYHPCDGGDLLTPHWTSQVMPNVQRVGIPEKLRDNLPVQYKVAIASEMEQHWGQSHQQIEVQFIERIQCIQLETAERMRLLNHMLDDVRTQMEERITNPSESNQQWIQLRLRPRQELLRNQINAISQACQTRCDLLRQSFEHIKSPSAESVVLQLTARILLRADPEAILEDISRDTANTTDFQQPPTDPDPAANPHKPR
ncbi:hypothetical protein CKO51_27125 [Rhodopirellula sp. SM50]|nr:DEAD/DEAH box helicase [Rhodopirellula sp. SM50]PAY16328.1 hypothetical protein CKO51_27125 [Rhodopirellula sp. SM50]